MNNKTYIEHIIQEYNRVYLVSEELSEKCKSCNFAHLNLGTRKNMLISTKMLNNKGEQVVFELIDEEIARELFALYHTYEFADNFVLLEQSSTFATIFNYVQAGILTPEEAWQAFMGDRDG